MTSLASRELCICELTKTVHSLLGKCLSCLHVNYRIIIFDDFSNVHFRPLGYDGLMIGWYFDVCVLMPWWCNDVVMHKVVVYFWRYVHLP